MKRQELGALRLVREETEVFWIVALNTQHQVIEDRPLTSDPEEE